MMIVAQTEFDISTRSVMGNGWSNARLAEENSIHTKINRNEGPEDIGDNDIQEALLLFDAKQRYIHIKTHPIPKILDDREVLIEIEVIGLNPIDWKVRSDFGYGLPILPCVSGRDFTGRIIKLPKSQSRFELGDRVLAVSTEYRDSRKAAYQNYAVASDYNISKLPAKLKNNDAASLGVAFVAAALALGVCFGMSFRSSNNNISNPDILSKVWSLNPMDVPNGIQDACFRGIRDNERPEDGDWIAIWRGSSATGFRATQLAKLAGLRVIAIVDVARSGERTIRSGADLIVDRLDTERAISIIISVTNGKLRFGLDTTGKESAALQAKALQLGNQDSKRSHLVGLAQLPKERLEGIVYHSVPIKLFHESSEIGSCLTLWLEELLKQRLLITPDIEVAEGGLEGVNKALDRLRHGTSNGRRVVVPLRK